MLAIRRGSEGLIPAWAGKTVNINANDYVSRAHPRVGGENAQGVVKEIEYSGSSPRGRGKRWPLRTDENPAGLIPAWAGKTRSAASHRDSRRAHPRVGGENSEGLTPTFARTGSSPRGRGKRSYGEAGSTWDGLIPAWAGKTHHGCFAFCVCVGLIPAWAGKTIRHRGEPVADGAHPRVGGENGT